MTTMEVLLIIEYDLFANFTFMRIVFKYTFIRHLNFFIFCDDRIELFLAVGALVFGFGPFLNAVVAEHVATALNFCNLIVFYFFDADCANITR